MADLVRNPKDWFSPVMAHLKLNQFMRTNLLHYIHILFSLHTRKTSLQISLYIYIHRTPERGVLGSTTTSTTGVILALKYHERKLLMQLKDMKRQCPVAQLNQSKTNVSVSFEAVAIGYVVSVRLNMYVSLLLLLLLWLLRPNKNMQTLVFYLLKAA